MLKTAVSLLLSLPLLSNCVINGRSNPKDFVLEVGDYWIQDYFSGSFPSKTFSDDKVYCSSINSNTLSGNGAIKGLPNYLYCFNLKTGKVDWRYEVEAFATAPPIILDTLIYFSTFTGDLHCLTRDGKLKWKRMADGSFTNHSFNPFNNNLYVSTVENGIFEYDAITGEQIKNYGKSNWFVFGSTFPIIVDSLIVYSYDKPFEKKSKSSQIICVDYGGDIRWKKSFGEIEFVLENKKKLFFVDDDNFYCLDFYTGETLWSIKNDRNWEERIGFSNDIVFLSNGASIAAFDINSSRKIKTDPKNTVKSYSVIINKNEKYSITAEVDFFSTLRECEVIVQKN